MSAKVNEETILEEISADIPHYLRNGRIENILISATEADLNIKDLDRLLRIHFVLTEDVKNFSMKLEERIRRIKTTVSSHKNEYRGQVRGRISWKDTVSRRMATNPLDSTLFMCIGREKEYNIPENLVLKRILQIIHGIVYSELKPAIDEKYKWVDIWSDKEGVKEVLNSVYLKNIYLRRVSLEDVSITENMIQRAKKSRQPLYRDAARLLERYRKIAGYHIDKTEARELLKNTFIKPEKTEVLFELYWIIKIMNSFGKEIWEKPIIEKDNDSVIAEAILRDFRYVVYHNATGSFHFHEKIPDNNKLAEINKTYPFLARKAKVVEKLNEMVGMNKNTLWEGRPDILIEKYHKDGDEPVCIFIGEVKYTNDKRYAIEGLKELLEYLALIKKDEEYLESFDSLFEGLENVRGGLFTDQIGKFSISEDEKIFHIMFENSENKIRERIVKPMLERE